MLSVVQERFGVVVENAAPSSESPTGHESVYASRLTYRREFRLFLCRTSLEIALNMLDRPMAIRGYKPMAPRDRWPERPSLGEGRRISAGFKSRVAAAVNFHRGRADKATGIDDESVSGRIFAVFNITLHFGFGSSDSGSRAPKCA